MAAFHVLHHRGRIEVVLTSYALNEQELAVVRGEVERDALREILDAVAGNAAGALSEIVKAIEGLVPGPPKEEQEPEDTNSFMHCSILEWRKARTLRTKNEIQQILLPG